MWLVAAFTMHAQGPLHVLPTSLRAPRGLSQTHSIIGRVGMAEICLSAVLNPLSSVVIWCLLYSSQGQLYMPGWGCPCLDGSFAAVHGSCDNPLVHTDALASGEPFYALATLSAAVSSADGAA